MYFLFILLQTGVSRLQFYSVEVELDLSIDWNNFFSRSDEAVYGTCSAFLNSKGWANFEIFLFLFTSSVCVVNSVKFKISLYWQHVNKRGSTFLNRTLQLQNVLWSTMFTWLQTFYIFFFSFFHTGKPTQKLSWTGFKYELKKLARSRKFFFKTW